MARPDDPDRSTAREARPEPVAPVPPRVRRSWRKAIRQRQARFREARADLRLRLATAAGGVLAPVTEGRQRVRQWVEGRRRWVYPLAGLGVAVAFGFLPFLSEWFHIPLWLQRGTNGTVLAQFALFSLFALGLNVVVGFAGLLDLGYVAFWAIGAYTAGLLSGAAGYSKAIRTGGGFVASPQWHMWMWSILLVALLVAVVAGILLGSPTLRLRGDYLAIVTLGFGEIIRVTANNLDSITLGPQGITNIPHPAIRAGPIDIEWGTLTDNKYYWLLLTFVVLWVVAITMLNNSRIGRAWVAIREDEVAAAAMGVPVVRMKLAAFAIGACTAGVGGVVFAQQTNFLNPDYFPIIQSVLIVCMVVIGGMGSIAGAIVGAGLITLLPQMFRGFEDYRFFIFGLALVIVMAFRPQGLIPSRRRKAELRAGAVVDQQLYEAARAGGGGA